jgi:hypothetical protein
MAKPIIENKKLQFFLAVIFAAVGLNVLAFIGFKTLITMIAMFSKPTSYPTTLGYIENKCEDIGWELKKYYAKKGVDSQNISASDFFHYLVDTEGEARFSIESPPEKYSSPFDFGIYLYLPSKIESETAVLIGHTTKYKWGNNRMGTIIFLKGSDLIIVSIQEWQFNELVGKVDRKPDFYCWRNWIDYIQDRMSQKRKDANSRGTGK